MSRRASAEPYGEMDRGYEAREVRCAFFGVYPGERFKSSCLANPVFLEQ